MVFHQKWDRAVGVLWRARDVQKRVSRLYLIKEVRAVGWFSADRRQKKLIQHTRKQTSSNLHACYTFKHCWINKCFQLWRKCRYSYATLATQALLKGRRCSSWAISCLKWIGFIWLITMRFPPFDPSVPSSPPSNFSGHNLSSTSIQVTWGDVPKSSIRGILLGFHVACHLVNCS